MTKTEACSAANGLGGHLPHRDLDSWEQQKAIMPGLPEMGAGD